MAECRRRGGRVSGLTLVEVLATVFVLGMGLIMVAAAFPVGLDQNRRTVADTQGTMAGRSAAEIVRARHLIQDMDEARLRQVFIDSYYKSKSPSLGVVRLAGKAPRSDVEPSEEWRIFSPLRSAYGNPTDPTDPQGKKTRWFYTAAEWPPASGDLVWMPFVMRISGRDDPPVFRLTIVVVRYDSESPETFDTKVNAGSSVKDVLYPAKARALDNVAAGDYIMNWQDGLCYRVIDVNTTGGHVVSVQLDRTPERAFKAGGGAPDAVNFDSDFYQCHQFHGVVGVYYTFVQ